MKYRGNYRRIQQAVLSREPYESVYDPVSFLCIGDPEYPAEFYRLKSPPRIVFYEGDLSLLKTRKIAIVGSRIQSDY
ncbi:MAG: DNA-processing protein DprA, partial [Erysipelotrichales bacterium]|nr:DNA-processing protein DprA [Erysipelotrichales bacterium]